jgi:hypothetical protein
VAAASAPSYMSAASSAAPARGTPSQRGSASRRSAHALGDAGCHQRRLTYWRDSSESNDDASACGLRCLWCQERPRRRTNGEAAGSTCAASLRPATWRHGDEKPRPKGDSDGREHDDDQPAFRRDLHAGAIRFPAQFPDRTRSGARLPAYCSNSRDFPHLGARLHETSPSACLLEQAQQATVLIRSEGNRLKVGWSEWPRRHRLSAS